MAIAQDADSHTTAATRTNTTVLDPSIDADDIIILFMDIEDDVTPTPPAGFTLIANVDHPDQTFDLWVWRKRADGTEGDLTITHSSTWTQAGVSIYSGASTVGDPQNVAATENTEAAGTSMVASDLIPPDNGSMIVICGTSWGNAAKGVFSGTSPTFSERIDDSGNIVLADGLQATAAAVGDRTSVMSQSTESIAVMISLRDPAADGGTPVTYSVDALLKATQTVGYSVDALLKATTPAAYSVDALLKATFTTTHAVDALLKATTPATYSVDALLKATSTKTHAVDALLKATTPVTYSVDALLKATQTVGYSVDALLKAEGQTVGHVVDALLVTPGVQVTYSVDALLKATQTAAYSVDALLKATQTVGHAVDALLKATSTVGYSVDAFLVGTPVTYSVDALLKATIPATYAVDALLQAQGQIVTYSVDALLQATQTITHAVDALLKATQTVGHVVDAIIGEVAAQTVTYSVDAVLVIEGALVFEILTCFDLDDLEINRLLPIASGFEKRGESTTPSGFEKDDVKTTLADMG